MNALYKLHSWSYIRKLLLVPNLMKIGKFLLVLLKSVFKLMVDKYPGSQ
jgi:hypothetical protein